MNAQYKNIHWYKELKSHIELMYEVSGTHKTVLITGPHFYICVSRVNYLTIKLWVEFINVLIKSDPNFRVRPITKIGWLEFQKQYRRNLEKELYERLQDRQKQAAA